VADALGVASCVVAPSMPRPLFLSRLPCWSLGGGRGAMREEPHGAGAAKGAGEFSI